MTKVEYICFTELSGYGIAASNYVRSLSNCDVSVAPLDFKRHRKTAWNFELYPQDDDPERIQIFHCTPVMQRRRDRLNKVTIGFATFETFSPPDYWIEILNKNSAVIAPSMFCKTEFEKAGVKVPIHYVPHCLDFKEFNTDVTPVKSYDKFTFLFVGAWKLRKGYDILLKAWEEEFDKREPVQLLLKTHSTARAEHYCKQYENTINLQIIDKIFTEQELPGFLKSADCIVAPSRGEGFGLTGLQALVLGVPLITVDHTGCNEYSKLGMSLNLTPEDYVQRYEIDRIRQFCNKRWGEVSVPQLRRALREMYNNYGVYVHKVMSNRHLLDKFNMENVGRVFEKSFSPENTR